MSTVHHGSNADCPDVASGKHKYCHGHNSEQTAKHTLGPWQAINQTDALRTGEHIWNIRTPNGGVAAWIDGLCDSETKTANAKLIAAAPELLEACLLVLPEIECKTGPSEELDRLRAAIRKATE